MQSTTQNVAPTADAGDDRTVLPGQTALLDGTASTDPEGATLTYSWTKLSGPAGTLTSSTAPTARFVPSIPGTYVLQLAVSDGDLTGTDTVTVIAENRDPAADAGDDDGTFRGEPAVANVEVVPPDTTLTVHPGLNLITLPLAALEDGRSMTPRDLSRRLGAGFLVKTNAAGRFDTQIGSLGDDDPAIEGGRGYLLRVDGGRSRTISLAGPAWSSSSFSVSLLPGVNFVGYPGLTIPPDLSTTAGLRGSLIAVSYIAQLVPTEDGRTRFQVYLPPLTASFRLQTGRGYLIATSEAQLLFWPR